MRESNAVTNDGECDLGDPNDLTDLRSEMKMLREACRSICANACPAQWQIDLVKSGFYVESMQPSGLAKESECNAKCRWTWYGPHGTELGCFLHTPEAVLRARESKVKEEDDASWTHTSLQMLSCY